MSMGAWKVVPPANGGFGNPWTVRNEIGETIAIITRGLGATGSAESVARQIVAEHNAILAARPEPTAAEQELARVRHEMRIGQAALRGYHRDRADPAALIDRIEQVSMALAVALDESRPEPTAPDARDQESAALRAALDRHVCGYCRNRVGFDPDPTTSPYPKPCASGGCAPLRAALAAASPSGATTTEGQG